jgi:hypothetical protein
MDSVGLAVKIVVEMRRFELLTPYMRSKASTKSEKTKKPRNSGKNQ